MARSRSRSHPRTGMGRKGTPEGSSQRQEAGRLFQQPSERWRHTGVVADDVRAVRRIHLKGRPVVKSRVVDLSIGANDLLLPIEFDHLVVELIADQRVAICQAYRTCG